MLKTIVLGLAVVVFAGVGAATAQSPAPGGIKRTPLQKVEFPKGYNIVTVIAEIPADTLAGRHTHPGVDTGYVLEGDATLIVEGKPAVLGQLQDHGGGEGLRDTADAHVVRDVQRSLRDGVGDAEGLYPAFPVGGLHRDDQARNPHPLHLLDDDRTNGVGQRGRAGVNGADRPRSHREHEQQRGLEPEKGAHIPPFIRGIRTVLPGPLQSVRNRHAFFPIRRNMDSTVGRQWSSIEVHAADGATPVNHGVRRTQPCPAEATPRGPFVEPMTGIEPAYSAWEADVLPLNYIGLVEQKG